ncbi:MAG: DUF3011 domain-containing protein, partial [Bdellovibrionales bacterium]|nr:DUF3011 domain-containing protein [Bdellovibrionales bacterium]
MRSLNSILVISLALIVGAQNLLADEYVKCESTNDNRTYCNISGARDANISLDRQLSKSSCREGFSWGRDDRGVWVDNGCRAEFRVDRRYGGGYGGDRYREVELERERLRLERERLD